MELITILLSGIASLFSLTGVVVDKSVESALLAQIDRAEQLQVRADNAPAHQVLDGKINKLRIAGRGLWVTKDLRVDTLDIETDPLAVDLQAARADQKPGSSPSSAFKQAVQAGLRLKFNEEDLNNYLKSPDAIAQLQKMTTSTFGGAAGSLNKDYKITNPQVKFLANNRVGLQAELQDPGSGEKLPITLETGVSVIGGRKLQLVEPTAMVGATPVPPFILSGLTTSLSERLNVDVLAARGLQARILRFKVDPQQLELAAFVRLPGKSQ